MPKRANNEGTIRQRADGTWEGRYSAGNDAKTGRTLRPSVYGETQQEVVAKLQKAIRTAKTGGCVKPSRKTVHAWMEEWVTAHVATLRAPGTVAGYYDVINAYIKPNISAKLTLRALETDHIQKMVHALSGRGLAEPTIRKAYSVLRAALNAAVKQKLIAQSPCTRDITFPAPSQEEAVYLTQAEQDALLAAIPDTQNGRAVQFALYTGMRVSEISGLRWGDLTDEYIQVKRTIRRATNPETGKGTILLRGKAKSQKSHRPIPIIPKSRAILEAQGAMRAPGCDLVFHTDTNSPLEAGELRASLARYVAAAKIKHIGMHSLRHTFATNALRAGVDMKTLSELLGHYDVAFTIRTYGHTDLATKKGALERMYGGGNDENV